MKNIPILSLVPRVVWLLLFGVVTNWACMTEMHFKLLGKWSIDPELGGIWRPATPLEFCGPLLWAAPGFTILIIVVMVGMHLLFRETIDADLNNGNFVKWWQAANFELKIKLVFYAIGIFVLSASILLAPLARA